RNGRGAGTPQGPRPPQRVVADRDQGDRQGRRRSAGGATPRSRRPLTPATDRTACFAAADFATGGSTARCRSVTRWGASTTTGALALASSWPRQVGGRHRCKRPSRHTRLTSVASQARGTTVPFLVPIQPGHGEPLVVGRRLEVAARGGQSFGLALG